MSFLCHYNEEDMDKEKEQKRLQKIEEFKRDASCAPGVHQPDTFDADGNPIYY